MATKKFLGIAVIVALIAGALIAIILVKNEPAGTSQNTSTASTAQQQGGVNLDYSGRGLMSFPEELLNRTDVTSLDISNNQLSGALPGEIRHMVNLQQLNVSNNRMTGIPAEIGQLRKLKVLNYNNNRITGLPMELGNLTQLQVLDLSGNNVSQQDLAQIRQKLTNTQIKL